MKKSFTLVAILILFISQNLFSQRYDWCYSPFPNYLNWNSIDPPIFEWIPDTGPAWYCNGGASVRYSYDHYTNDWVTIGFTVSWVDSFYVVTNSQWAGLELNHDYLWGVGPYFSGTPVLPNVGGDITRYQANLPPCTLLLPPNGFNGTEITPVLKWGLIDSASSYRVRIFDWRTLHNAIFDSLTFLDSIIVPSGLLNQNQTYWWRVKPYNSGGEGPFSDVFKFTTAYLNTPPPPNLISPTNGSINQSILLSLDWSDVSTSSSYGIQISKDPIFNTINLDDSGVTNSNLTLNCGYLSYDSLYYWRVRSHNTAGNGSWSTVWNFRIESKPSWYLICSNWQYDLLDVYFVNPNTGWACGIYGAIKTTNGGNSWSIINNTETYSSVFFIDANTGWLARTFDVVDKTTDGGTTWISQNVPGANQCTCIRFVNSTTGYVTSICCSGFYRTVNGGTTWTPISLNTETNYRGISFPSSESGQVGYVCGGHTGVCAIAKTTDHGLSWNDLSGVGNTILSSIFFVNDITGWAVGINGRIIFTSDGGSTWISQNSGTSSGLNSVYFVNGATGWVAGDGGVLLKTINSGTNWIQEPNSYGGLSSVTVVNSTGWAAGNSGLILKSSNIYNLLTPPALISPLYGATKVSLTPLLDWMDVVGAVKYKLLLSSDSLFSSTMINDSSLNFSQYSVPTGILQKNTIYYWCVAVKDVANWSAYSQTWNFRTIDAPSQVQLNSPSNNSLDQPVNLSFNWFKTSETLFKPYLNESGKSDLMKNNNSTNRDELIRINTKNRGSLNVRTGINDIISYWFELTTDTSSLANLIQDTILADTTKSVNGLTNSTAYYWRVKAKNEAGWGQFSTWWSFTTIVSAPIPPLLVSPFNNAIGQNISLNLVWNKASLATNYRVQVAADSLFNNLIVNDSTIIDSTKIISGLNPLTYYWWRVNAKNAGGTSSYSPIWKFRTIGVPYSVNLISPPNNATNQPLSITFLWSRAIEQTSPFISKQKKSEIKVNIFAINNYWFDIVTDTISFAGLLSDTTLTDTSKVLGGLNNATIYFWRVRGRNQIGWGSYSSWFNFTTIVSAPAPPLLFNPPDNSIGQDISLTLIWNKSAGAINYRVQVATDSLFTTFIVNDSTLIDSLKILSGLNPLTYYWWRVNAKNIGGTSGYSSVFKFRTVGNPFNVILISPLNNAINQPISLTCLWSKAVEQTSPLFVGKQNINRKDEINGISNYWFDMVTDTVSLSNLLRDSTLTDTLKTLNGLNFQTKYYWRVKAKNQIGWGGFSVWFNFTTADPPAALVNLTVIPGGFYNQNSGHLNTRDTVRVILVDSATCTWVDSTCVIIDSVTFSATPIVSFGRAQTGRYYIYVFHRNHIPISSAYTVGITRGGSVSYDFIGSVDKTYGSNLIQVSTTPARWGMIPGDANADQYVDGLDQTIWIIQNGLEGYIPSDFNGDRYVDGLDQTLWIQANGCGSYLPCEFSEFRPGMHKTRVIQGKDKKNTNWNIIPPKNTQEEKKKGKTINK